MANTPCTLVLFSEDPINFPLRYVHVVVKELFQYGVKAIKTRGDKVYVYLSYCPKGNKLKQKLGNLPLRYMRTKIDNEEDFKILEKIVKMYKFNLLDEEESEAPQSIAMKSPSPAVCYPEEGTSSSPPRKKKTKLTVEEVYSESEDSDKENALHTTIDRV